MLSSFRLGTAAILAMGALTAGCAGPVSSASSGGTHMAAADMPLYASIYTDDARFYAPRDYRSKCDDESSKTQRLACFETEREEELMQEDGKE